MRECENRRSCRVLLPKVISSGRERRKCWRGCLHVTGLPDHACGPFVLEEVFSLGAACWESLEAACQRGRLCGEVSIPLRCRVRDGCGRVYSGSACVVMDACVTMEGGVHQIAGCQWIFQSRLRLACGPVCSPSLCFEGELEIDLEINGVCWQKVGCAMEPKPCCPDLPLYPPPCR